MNMRHEEYSYGEAPFYFNTDLVRTKNSVFPDMNWHDGIELQLCTDGNGIVFIDGTKHILDERTLIVINSNSIHYTITDNYLKYSALILNPIFCKKMGIDCDNISFNTIVQDNCVLNLIKSLQELHICKAAAYSTAKETSIILQILITLAENCSKGAATIRTKGKSFAYVKSTINYIRNNYNNKLQLDDIAAAACVDKYFLSRAFKEATGKTIVEYINTYRCNRAASLIKEGYTVSEAAGMCGFDNFSYFTKTFKRIVGILPSKVNKHTT